MSIKRVAGADRGAGFVAPIRLVLPDLLFVLLAVYNAIRLFRHAMWRDELQSPPATRRSISSPTLNMKAIPGSCICCCGDHALHHRSGGRWFWEHFVVSRPYASVLLGFGFVALQARRPERFRP